jgi:branched-chain amino acid transport system permease protein
MAVTTEARIGSTAGARLNPQTVGVAIVLALVLAWLVWNFTASPSAFFEVAAGGLANGAIYALIALGYTLVYGIMELINFAHGDVFMMGSVIGAHFLIWFGMTGSSPGNWAILAGIVIICMVSCGAINAVIERIAYRPLRNAPKLAPLITAIGASFIVANLGLVWNGPGQVSTERVLPGGQAFQIRGVSISWMTLIIIGVTIPLLMAMTYIVQRTRQGMAMRAVAQDADAARLMGVDVNRTILFTFLLGGALAGAAGVLYMQDFTTTRWDAGFQLGLIAFTAAVLGGIGDLRGAVVGAVGIGIVQGLNDGLAHGLGQQWSQTVVFSILIIILVFRPEGLFGTVVAEKV